MESSHKYGTILNIVYVDGTTEKIMAGYGDAINWLSAICADPVIASVYPRPATLDEYNEHANFSKSMLDVFAKLDIPKELLNLEENFSSDFISNCKNLGNS